MICCDKCKEEITSELWVGIAVAFYGVQLEKVGDKEGWSIEKSEKHEGQHNLCDACANRMMDFLLEKVDEFPAKEPG